MIDDVLCEVQKNQAYAERNALVAFLSRVMPAYLTESDDPDWPIVYIDSPEGQLSWHLQRKEVDWWFGHLEWRENNWDGHDTAEKYARLERITGYLLTEDQP